MFIFYDVVLIFLFIAYLPFLIIKGKWQAGFKERLGFLSKEWVAQFGGRKCIWIHAVSVGEVLAIRGLVEKLSEEFPQHKIVCSTVTKTGYQVACKGLGEYCQVIYAPLDFSWTVCKFITIVDPKIYISTETEIWPNLYRLLHQKGIPIVQINGRISDQAFRGYKRAAFLIKQIVSCVEAFYMQSPLDAKRIKDLGASSSRVNVFGNLKFDNAPDLESVKHVHLGFQEDADILMAGSTHPGEEMILIEAYGKLLAEFPKLRLVIAPRHIERSREVCNLILEKGYKVVLFSKVDNHQMLDKEMVVVDTLGDLASLYSRACIVFIGKTLAVGGGQNMIESACFGKPTIVGPLTQNFKDVMSMFLRKNAIIQVQSASEFVGAVRGLLRNSHEAGNIGDSAQRIVQENQGATVRTLDAIRDIVKNA